MENTEKIKDLMKLLNMNQDHLCYELNSLAAKVNNFLDDRTRMLSGQLISVMYKSLTEDIDSETVEINTNKSIENYTYETIEKDANENVEIDINDIPGEASPSFDDSRFALV